MLTRNNFNLSDYSLKNGEKFDLFADYTDEKWLLVQMQIDANQKERIRQEKKAEQDFKITLFFVGIIGLLCSTLFIAVATQSYLAVSEYKNNMELKK